MKTLVFIVNLFFGMNLASGVTIIYTGTFSGAAEAPPNDSLGTGTVEVILDTDLEIMTIDAEFSGLTGTTTIAHIHGPTPVPGAETAGVMTTTPTFPGFPAGVTSGTYNQVIDLSLAASYNSTFVTANGGVAGAYNAFTTALAEGRAYFNIHTTSFPGGEIRAFLIAVPEPGVAGLAALGAGVALRRRRGRATLS